MPFVQAKCENCNAPLTVDTTQKTAKCNHCGTPYLIEDAINYNNYYIYGDYAKRVTDSPVLTTKMRMKLDAAEANLKMREFGDAQKKFARLSIQIPQEYRVWWGQIRALTKEFTAVIENKAVILRLCGLYDSMMHFVPEQKKNEIEQRFMDYIQLQDQRLERRIGELHVRQRNLEEEYAQLQNRIQEYQEKTYPNSEEQILFLKVILGAALVFGIFGNTIILLFALVGFGLFYTVLIPGMKQHAAEWESERKRLITDCSKRSLELKQELKQIEEELSGLV